MIFASNGQRSPAAAQDHTSWRLVPRLLDSRLASRELGGAALGNQFVQIAPPVRAVKLALLTVKTFRTECLIESIRRICGFAEQQHGGNAPAQELSRHIAEQKPTNTLSLNALNCVDLIQLPDKARHATIVKGSLCERHELSIVILDDETKPAAVGDRKRFAPLPLSQFVGWPTRSSAAMRLVECLHM
jgi:hypothetical protein